MERTCLNCGDPVTGRADKKFCSDHCRSEYNYGSRSGEYSYVKRVNYILRKNWNLLTELNPDGKAKVKRSRMIEKGFNFNYFTGMYTNKNGTTYYYVYNKGYLPIDEEYVALVERPEYLD
jgi:hypothetical protein